MTTDTATETSAGLRADTRACKAASRTRRKRRLIALLAVLIALSGCACGTDTATRGGVAGSNGPTTTRIESSRAESSTAPATVPVTIVEPSTPLAVRSDHDLALYVAPLTEEPIDVALAKNSFGSPLVLLVTRLGSGAWSGWFEVLVPGRPNGRTAWVRATEVTVNEVEHEVQVDLTSRTLRVVQDGREILTTPVAVGKPTSPTPTGRFSLTDKLDTGQPNGPYGPFALGLSARSDALTEFAGGDAQVGIHGTDVPSSIGNAASHGCIRVPNEVVVQLSQMLALGTPVTVS